MVKHLLSLSFLLLTVIETRAQVYDYNFGTVVDSITSGSAVSPTFLPSAPDGASAYARVGSGGGKIVVKNYSGFGTGSSLRLQAPTGTSVNKFSIYGLPNASTTMGLKLTFSLGDSVNSATSNISSGTFYFFAGNGANYGNANQFAGSQTFAGVRLVLGPSNAALSVRVPLIGWYSDPTTPLTVPYGTPVTVVLYMNNGTTSVTYTDINSTSRTLAAGYTDLFANGVYQTSVPNPGLAAGSNLNAFMFYAESSLNNQANLFVDDIVYTNNIVANTLPLKLSFFDAIPDNNTVRLFWKTEVETDIKEYIIEHSKDGKNFAAVGKVTSLRTNGSSYTFTHDNPSATNFYRLRINNQDGHAEYSQVVMVKLKNGNTDMQVWYNESKFHFNQHKDADVKVYDMSGRRVLNTMIRSTDYELDLSFLAPGSYIAHVRSDKEVAVVKFVK